MYLKQFDVSTAFIHDELNETVYMQQPERYSDESSKVCELLRNLYGLKQAPQCWNRKIETFLTQQGFKVSSADPCVYIRIKDDKKLLLAVYVDDGLLAAADTKDLECFINQLEAEVEVTVKEASYFLVIEIDSMKV